MLAFSRTYFDQASLNNKIIPESYNNATLLIAEHFSATDREMTSVLVERVRALITLKEYVELVQLGLAEVEKTLEAAENTNTVTVSLVTIKEKLTSTVAASTGRMGSCSEKEELKSQVLLCVPRAVALEEGRSKMKQNIVQLIENEIPDVASFNTGIDENGTAQSDLAQQNAQEQFRQMIALRGEAGLLHQGITTAIFVALLVYAVVQLIIQFSAHRVMYFVGGVIVVVSGMVRTIAENIAELPRVIGLQNQLTYGQEQLIRFIIAEPLPLLTKMSTILSVVGILIIMCGVLYKRQMSIRKSDTVL